MKRLSLADKIQVCQLYGTLKTFSESEALDHFRKYCTEGELDGVSAYYEQGKYLCGFISNGKLECLETVYQIGSLPFFVKELVYPLIQTELEISPNTQKS